LRGLRPRKINKVLNYSDKAALRAALSEQTQSWRSLHATAGFRKVLSVNQVSNFSNRSYEGFQKKRFLRHSGDKESFCELCYSTRFYLNLRYELTEKQIIKTI
jgi:hypothetical protein